MATDSKIQWTDHTVNFWTGCKKVSPGCKFCYMFRDQERYGKEPTDVLQVAQKTINKVLKAAKPGDKIFTCSWSDFFIEEADQWRDWAWQIIRENPHLNWQILTKRPERIMDNLPPDWGQGWDHVWLGVSAENQDLYQLRMLILSMIPAKIRFVSIEPILGPINLHPWISLTREHRSGNPGSAIDWVIVGGESGNDNGKWKYRAADLDWFNDIVKQLQFYKVPVFVKQMGTHIAKEYKMFDRNGGDIAEFPEAIQVRQFPANMISHE